MTTSRIISSVIVHYPERKSKIYDHTMEKQHNSLWYDYRHFTLAGSNSCFLPFWPGIMDDRTGLLR